MSPWSLLVPGFGSALEGLHWPGGVADRLVFVVLFCALVDFAKLVIELLGRGEPREFVSDDSQVTVVIACRDGADVIGATVGELRRAHPRAHVLVVDDGSSDGTAELARSLGCEVHRFERSKGKASAIHFALHRVRTPLVLLLDDDTRLGGARLPTSLLLDGEADAVAFRVLPDRRNRDGARGNGFLGAIQRYEYAKSMEVGKRFHDLTQSVSCVSGAIGLFRTRDLDALHHRHTTVFQGEDLQRTLLHLLAGKRVAFADEPVWTVTPWRWSAWLRQRVSGWYPGLYHQFANMLRLMVSRRSSWRLRYEMAYNVYTTLSDPLKTWSILVILAVPTMRPWGLVVYATYLAFEWLPWWVIRRTREGRRTPLGVLLAYPLYGAANTLLRTAAFFVWLWYRWVTGTMRPRRGPRDRALA